MNQGATRSLGMHEKPPMESALADNSENLSARSEDGLRLHIDSKPHEVSAALDQIDQVLADDGVDEDQRSTVQVVLAEVLNNIVEHAYEFRSGGDIQIQIEWTDAGVTCEINDGGKEMPGLKVPKGDPPDTMVAFDDLPEGGFGWFLIHQMTTGLEYDRDASRNVLRFTLTAV